MSSVLLALILASLAILGERVARQHVSRSTAWLTVHPAVFVVASLVLGLHVPASSLTGSWMLAVVGAAAAGVSYEGLRWLCAGRSRRPLAESYPLKREGLALVVVLPVVEQMLWGWILTPALGTLVVAALFAIKHPLSDGNWRRSPALVGFWLGMSLVRSVNPFLAIVIHMLLNGVAFAKTVRSRRDEF